MPIYSLLNFIELRYFYKKNWTEQMLELLNVSKSFWTGTQRKVILDDASFHVELGTSLGILAPNGTGKTTINQYDGRVGKA
jgi:ABC-type polysaccharide/polyol phosphate transport system ATPase subunit